MTGVPFFQYLFYKMTFKKIFIMGFLGFNLFSNQTTAQTGFSKIDKTTFVQAISSDAAVQVVDVRTPGEFNTGHFENAVNLDFYSPDFSTQLDKLDKTKPVYLYCRSGNRSGKAAKMLVDKGFGEIYDLKGGY